MSENLQAHQVEQHEKSRIPEFMNLGIADIPGERLEQLATVDAKGLLDIATSIHEIVAPDLTHVPHDKAVHIQSPGGSSRRELMKPGDRLSHFDHAAGLVQQLVEINKADDNEQLLLNRISNVLALAVVQAHTFEDGNGRTARTLAQLIREGTGKTGSEEQDNLMLASTNRPSTGFRINSFVPTGDGVNMSPNEILDKAAAVEIPLKEHGLYLEQQHRVFTSPYQD